MIFCQEMIVLSHIRADTTKVLYEDILVLYVMRVIGN